MTEQREAYHAGNEPPELLPAITNTIHFGDGSQLRLQVLAPRGLDQDQATEAYYRVIAVLDDPESNAG